MKNIRRLTLIAIAAALLLPLQASAAWDKTKPATSTTLVSADIRANWAALEVALAGVNLLADPTFLIWPAETVNTLQATGAAHWTLSGAAATYDRTGTGLTDTNRKVGANAAKVVAGGAAVAVLEQQLLTTTSFDSSFQGQQVSMGAWIRCTAASAGRLRITDGVNTSFSSFHTGGSTFEWLTIAGHSINASATKLTAGMEVAISQTCHLSGPTFVLGSIPPAVYQPAPVAYGAFTQEISGAQTVAANKFRWFSPRPVLIKDVELVVRTTGPTGANYIVNVKSFDGAAMTTMYTTRPQIVAGATLGGARPDAAYARRCLTGIFDATAGTGSFLQVDVDQIGSTLPGTDIVVQIRYLYYQRPLEAFLGYNEQS